MNANMDIGTHIHTYTMLHRYTTAKLGLQVLGISRQKKWAGEVAI